MGRVCYQQDHTNNFLKILVRHHDSYNYRKLKITEVQTYLCCYLSLITKNYNARGIVLPEGPENAEAVYRSSNLAHIASQPL